MVAPGHRSQPENYNNSIASQFLPAQLEDRPQAAKPQTTFGKVANITHPLFQRYGKDLDSMLARCRSTATGRSSNPPRARARS